MGFWLLLCMLALLSRLLVCFRVLCVSWMISVLARQVRLLSGSLYSFCFIRFWISFYYMQPAKFPKTTSDTHIFLLNSTNYNWEILLAGKPYKNCTLESVNLWGICLGCLFIILLSLYYCSFNGLLPLSYSIVVLFMSHLVISNYPFFLLEPPFVTLLIFLFSKH